MITNEEANVLINKSLEENSMPDVLENIEKERVSESLNCIYENINAITLELTKENAHKSYLREKVNRINDSVWYLNELLKED